MVKPCFLQMDRARIEDGSWFEEARAAWGRGEVGLVLIEPQTSGDAQLRAAIETMLASNGSYEVGDRAVVHTRPAALDMGCETAFLLRERGIEATVVFGMTSLGPQVAELIGAAARAAEAAAPPAGHAAPGAPPTGTGGGTLDVAALDPAILQGVAACYRQLLDPIAAQGRGHWIVPIGTAPDPEPRHVPSLDFFSKVAGRGLAPLGELRQNGRVRSHDIWLYPSELDVARLNEGLSAERQWTLEEWRALVFRAMAVSAEELRRRALAIPAVALTVRAAERGGTLRYQRADGTDFTYRVQDRPVILDCGRVGTNSLGETPAYRSAITNQPTTEVFVGPLEDSLNGVIVYTLPERTVHGVIQAPYRIEVRDGRVTDVRAPDAESLRILRNYTGLAPYDGRPLEGEARAAFDLRRIIAEVAIAGFNPAMLPEIENGRLRPVTGSVLMDEKLGDHQAFGSNDQFMGTTPSTYGSEHVEHTDFVGGIAREVTLA